MTRGPVEMDGALDDFWVARFPEGPFPGSKWFRPNRVASRGSAWRAETRWVIDRTLGGDVVFTRGRARYVDQCTLSEWQEWAKHAQRSGS